MYTILEIYGKLNKYNSFIVNGFVCENGAHSALLRKPMYQYDRLLFTYGNFDIIDDTEGADKTCADGIATGIVGFEESPANFFNIRYDNGMESLIYGYNRELPKPISFGFSSFNDIDYEKLLDERLLVDYRADIKLIDLNLLEEREKMLVCTDLIQRVSRKAPVFGKTTSKIYPYVDRMGKLLLFNTETQKCADTRIRIKGKA